MVMKRHFIKIKLQTGKTERKRLKSQFPEGRNFGAYSRGDKGAELCYCGPWHQGEKIFACVLFLLEQVQSKRCDRLPSPVHCCCKKTKRHLPFTFLLLLLSGFLALAFLNYIIYLINISIFVTFFPLPFMCYHLPDFSLDSPATLLSSPLSELWYPLLCFFLFNPSESWCI